MLRIIILLVTFAFAGFAFADCRVRLKHPVPNCPAVTYGPGDCLEDLWGKSGQLVTSPATIHVMTSGHSYYCPSHEGCIEMKDLDFKGCVFKHVPRFPGESKEYASHIDVE